MSLLASLSDCVLTLVSYNAQLEFKDKMINIILGHGQDAQPLVKNTLETY